MRTVKVMRYSISKPYKEGSRVYSDKYSLDECYKVYDLRPFGISRMVKTIKSYKSEKALMNYISKNKINLNEKIEFELK